MVRRLAFGVALPTALAAPAMAAEPNAAAPIEVMVVGSYHFGNPGLDLNNVKADDVLKPQRQKELEELATALAQFHPTKIAVERIAKSPALIDHRFAELAPADLNTNRDERYQIAYRLARQLNMATVYAIDEQPDETEPVEPDYFPFDKVVAWAKANGKEAALDGLLEQGKAVTSQLEKWQAEGSIAHVLLNLNQPAQTERDQRWYYRVLEYGDTDKQPGAELNAYWYMRNAKIFGKLMTVAKPGDRILVVYGSGHNYWLRHFAATTPGYRNVDPSPYLRKAE
ncbi:DUF5694 domain-containing protein [Sphingomonas sp. RB56-2]|uniref:DUF5694 domain-containing protein n=1 Tax=Sphingomonas brevis TaxID=2908206 RepID=A0ABT0S6Q2_9SPHN|nr:DUF5694 domain-containing protein [Sphingomonas brevis]MCL6739977.1 DUF5694 domain-containing protein [Sphingomonas brevis]